MPAVFDVVLLPADLRSALVTDRAVAVFDVLRATTTMTAGLDAGLAEIRIFPTPDAAQSAAAAFVGPKLLLGERQCLPPAGFDLGNSPGQFDRAVHGGRSAFMSTTNGTLAILSAGRATLLLAAALVNRSAVAEALLHSRLPVTLLCAGTEGGLAVDDLIGAGAVAERLVAGGLTPAGDTARLALHVWRSACGDLPAALRDTQGGRNLLAAGLPDDIDFAARVDAIPVAGVVVDAPAHPRVVRGGGGR